MGFEIIAYNFFKDLKTKYEVAKVAQVTINNESTGSPKTRELIRKNKSEENFMKFQVPWIL